MTKNSSITYGFTIIEILVVVAIIGILVGVTVPTLSKYLPGVALNGSARTLTSDLRVSQERAVTEQKQYSITFYNLTAGVPYYKMISYTNGNPTVVRTVSFQASEVVALDQGITNNQIVFSPDGGPSSSGNINLSLGTNSKIVNVSPAGFIKIQ